MSLIMFVFMKMSFLLRILNRKHIHQHPSHNLHTSHPWILPKSFSLLLHNLAKPAPLFCHLPHLNRFCNHFITAQPCHIVIICLFFQWSSCRNRFPIDRCSCFQVYRRFVGVYCVDQSLHRLSSWPAALYISLLVSSLATSRYKLFSSITSCLSTSHGPPS